MPSRSDRQVALITGAGRGIGRAIAEAFAAEGWSVVIAEVQPALGRRTERALKQKGADALFVQTDVANSRSVERAVRTALRRFHRLDCVVNNAGVLTPGPLGRLPLPDLEPTVAVNFRGPLLVSRAAIPALRRRDHGSIVNVASQLGKQGIGEYVTYCATKFGVVGLTEALADELAGTGVRTALRAAALRPSAPFVATAFRAVGPRRRAAWRAWRASAVRLAAPRPSRVSARWMARDRVRAGLRGRDASPRGRIRRPGWSDACLRVWPVAPARASASQAWGTPPRREKTSKKSAADQSPRTKRGLGAMLGPELAA